MKKLLFFSLLFGLLVSCSEQKEYTSILTRYELADSIHPGYVLDTLGRQWKFVSNTRKGKSSDFFEDYLPVFIVGPAFGYQKDYYWYRSKDSSLVGIWKPYKKPETLIIWR